VATVVPVAGVAVVLLGLPAIHAATAAGVVAVHAVDYSYQGLPASLPAGETRFSFANDSKTEGHEMELFRINDGVNESLDQILADDEAQQNQQDQQNQPGGQQGGQNGGQKGGQAGGNQTPPTTQSPPPPPKMTFFATTGASPGGSAKMDLIGNLPAGRYGIVCYLPVNGDDANGPHYKKGMKAELTVQ
jgi:uncharacterized cupredoxin-like copper-binding protein